MTYEEFLEAAKVPGIYGYVGGSTQRQQVPGSRIIYASTVERLAGARYDGICLCSGGSYNDVIHLLVIPPDCWIKGTPSERVEQFRHLVWGSLNDEGRRELNSLLEDSKDWA